MPLCVWRRRVQPERLDLAVHTFDPFLTPVRGLEGISEVLRFVCNLYSAELHNAHGVEGFIVVCHDKLSDPQVAAPDDSMNHKAFLIRLEAPGNLYIVSTANPLAGLWIIQVGIFVIDRVLGRKIVGIGCCPMLIQRLTY